MGEEVFFCSCLFSFFWGKRTLPQVIRAVISCEHVFSQILSASYISTLNLWDNELNSSKSELYVYVETSRKSEGGGNNNFSMMLPSKYGGTRNRNRRCLNRFAVVPFLPLFTRQPQEHEGIAVVS